MPKHRNLIIAQAGHAVVTYPWGGSDAPHTAHANHRINAECKVCEGDIAAILAVALPVIAVELERDASPCWAARRPLPDPQHLDPKILLHLLTQCGWTQVADYYDGQVIRMAPPGSDSRDTHVILTDPQAAGYNESIRELLTELAGMAEAGWLADRVLSALADGSKVAVDQSTLLDEAMHAMWLHIKWRWGTQNMSSDAREAAAAAVLRYSRWQCASDPGEEPLPRSSVAVWEDSFYADRPISADGDNPLDAAMWTVWRHGDWRAATEKMTPRSRDLAAAAVLRYSQKLDPGDDDPTRRPLSRHQIVWWDR